MPQSQPAAELPVILDELAVLKVSGPERLSFLQGQFTQNMDSLGPARSVLTGWTSPKGRLLLVTQLMDWKESVWLPVPADMVEQIASRLTMFVLRARVSLEIAELMVLGALSDQSLLAGLINLEDLPMAPGSCWSDEAVCAARLTGDPARSLILVPRQLAGPGEPGGCAAWSLADIRAGIPRIHPPTSEIFVPQMLNLDVLKGISFTKGCYVGQEIVARTQNLGRIKRRMFRFRCSGRPDLEPGGALFGPDGPAGRIVQSAVAGDDTELLAVIPLTHVGTPLHADEACTVPLEGLSLPYNVPG